MTFLTFLFAVPPEKVDISGPKTARVGDNVTLTCLVENSNPPASVEWVVNSQPYDSGVTKKERAVSGGWHTVSRLAVTIPRTDRDMEVACHATNHAIGKTKVQNYKISVLSKY